VSKFQGVSLDGLVDALTILPVRLRMDKAKGLMTIMEVKER